MEILDERPILDLIERLTAEADRDDIPPNLRRLARIGARALSEMLTAARAGNHQLVQEIWSGTTRPDGKKANDGLLQILPRWARGVAVLDALAGVVVVDEAVQPPTVTVHSERVPRKLRPAAASLAAELVDSYYSRPKGGRPRTKKGGSETG